MARPGANPRDHPSIATLSSFAPACRSYRATAAGCLTCNIEQPTPSLAAIRRDRFANPCADILAGIVVTLALIPEAIGFSVVAGVDPRGRSAGSVSTPPFIIRVPGNGTAPDREPFWQAALAAQRVLCRTPWCAFPSGVAVRIRTCDPCRVKPLRRNFSYALYDLLGKERYWLLFTTWTVRRPLVGPPAARELDSVELRQQYGATLPCKSAARGWAGQRPPKGAGIHLPERQPGSCSRLCASPAHDGPAPASQYSAAAWKVFFRIAFFSPSDRRSGRSRRQAIDWLNLARERHRAWPERQIETDSWVVILDRLPSRLPSSPADDLICPASLDESQLVA